MSDLDDDLQAKADMDHMDIEEREAERDRLSDQVHAYQTQAQRDDEEICRLKAEVARYKDESGCGWKALAEKMYACLKVYDGPNFDVYKNKMNPFYVMGTKEALAEFEKEKL